MENQMEADKSGADRNSNPEISNPKIDHDEALAQLNDFLYKIKMLQVSHSNLKFITKQ